MDDSDGEDPREYALVMLVRSGRGPRERYFTLFFPFIVYYIVRSILQCRTG